jgi:hypothetical protein
MAPALQTKYVFSLAIEVGAPIVAGDLGHGTRRIIPILGGEVRGQGIKGTIFPCGADFQTIRPNGFTNWRRNTPSRWTTALSSTSRTSASASGRRRFWTGSPKGEMVDPTLIYFRSVPRFETGAENYRWLMENLFVGVGARHPDRVEIDVHQVL